MFSDFFKRNKMASFYRAVVNYPAANSKSFPLLGAVQDTLSLSPLHRYSSLCDSVRGGQGQARIVKARCLCL